MKNPKTTITGYLILLIAVATVAVHFLSGAGIGQADIAAVMAGLAGVGLIGATDGGH